MKLKLYKALWGLPGTYEEQLSSAAAEGYAGIEAPLPPPEKEAEFRRLLVRYDLEYIAQIVTAEEHVHSFAVQAEQAASYGPIKIVSHSARDSMPEVEQDRFFEAALEVERRIGIKVGHETHRGRAMFTPWTTARLLRRYPELSITADFSHWVNVCESHLDNHQSELELAFNHAIHIHGRVGYPEGPQVPHPAAPEYTSELKLFLGWWEQIFRAKRARGLEFMTLTPEFGPVGYMHTLPFTNTPVADLQEVNRWMGVMVRTSFEKWNMD